MPQRAAVTTGNKPTTTAENARQGVAKTQLYLEKIKTYIFMYKNGFKEFEVLGPNTRVQSLQHRNLDYNFLLSSVLK